jgi:DNA-binding protein HU-beta
MIKIDIANTLMQNKDFPVSKATALQVVDLLTDRMKKALLDGNRIEIRGFGVFEPRPRKKGLGRNIKTGASVEIPKGKSIRFKPGKELRDIDAEELAEA